MGRRTESDRCEIKKNNKNVHISVEECKKHILETLPKYKAVSPYVYKRTKIAAHALTRCSLKYNISFQFFHIFSHHSNQNRCHIKLCNDMNQISLVDEQKVHKWMEGILSSKLKKRQLLWIMRPSVFWTKSEIEKLMLA